MVYTGIGERKRLNVNPLYTDWVLGEVDVNAENGKFIWKDLVGEGFEMGYVSGMFQKVSGTYLAQKFTLDDMVWTPRNKVQEVEVELTTDTYDLKQYAMGTSWDPAEEDTSLMGNNLSSFKLAHLATQINLAMEKKCASVWTDTTFFTNTAALGSTARWDNFTTATSDPEGNFQTAKQSIYDNTGMTCTDVIVPYPVGLFLARHPQVKKAKEVLGEDMLHKSGMPKLLWGLNVIEPFSKYQNIEKLMPATTYSDIWGKTVTFFAKTMRTVPGTPIQSFVGPVALLKHVNAGLGYTGLINIENKIWHEEEKFYKVPAHICDIQFKQIHAGSSYVLTTVIT